MRWSPSSAAPTVASTTGREASGAAAPSTTRGRRDRIAPHAGIGRPTWTEGQMEKVEKVTAVALRARKGGARIVVVTAYDVAFARLAERGGVDAVLVGDSLGMVVQGHANTLPVTLDEM